MIAVVQRVSEAAVTVQEANHRDSIGPGLCVLLGVEAADSAREATWMAGKLAQLRIFRDEHDKMNRSVQAAGGEVLLVSQFTLSGDCTKGNRPSFIGAAQPDVAKPLYERVASILREEYGLRVATGVFGGDMEVALVNEGPVTVIIRSPKRG